MACFSGIFPFKNAKRSKPIEFSEDLLSPSDRLELSVDPNAAWRVLQVGYERPRGRRTLDSGISHHRALTVENCWIFLLEMSAFRSGTANDCRSWWAWTREGSLRVHF